MEGQRYWTGQCSQPVQPSKTRWLYPPKRFGTGRGGTLCRNSTRCHMSRAFPNFYFQISTREILAFFPVKPAKTTIYQAEESPPAGYSMILYTARRLEKAHGLQSS